MINSRLRGFADQKCATHLHARARGKVWRAIWRGSGTHSLAQLAHHFDSGDNLCGDTFHPWPASADLQTAADKRGKKSRHSPRRASNMHEHEHVYLLRACAQASAATPKARTS